jgi:hypothetical protein
MTYFSCAICHRVSGLTRLQLQCPYCGSLIGESSPEPPALPKGTVRPGDGNGLRDSRAQRRDRSPGNPKS